MKLSFSLALAWALLASAAHAASQSRFDFDQAPGRLSKDVRPSHYALQLTLDPDAEHFSGEARITLTVRKPVPAIVLHAQQLSARHSVLQAADGEQRPLGVTADDKTQTWQLRPLDGQPIAAGVFELHLAYDGQVQHTGAGLFAAPYPAAGKTTRMLATQLEAVYARLLFPAFDEPAFRSVFELAVRAPQGYEVLANMPAASVVAEGSQQLHRFAPTPTMPSYLVAVAVGRFDTLSGEAAGVPLRFLTVPGKRERAAYALASTEQLLPYYNSYFGVPYALPKLDQLAVPSGRDGAMEDWGLISYSEGLLLFDPATGGERQRRRIFSIVAHELAHQWFGNLVTAASWDEIWLNEAFATWLADKASEHFNPDWQGSLRQRSIVDRALERDGGPATRAIRSGSVPEDRVFEVFDNITYTKGGAVLSMLEQWIGEDKFRSGLGAYMRAQRFSNATAADLWFHIGQASDQDVASVAASWTNQPGFPLIGVASRCTDGNTLLELSQRRFSSTGAADASRWQVPLVIRHGDRNETTLLTAAHKTVTLEGCPTLPPLLNPGGEGFYRVAYAPAQHAALARAFDQLPPSTRITLLSDTFALAQAGQTSMSAYLDLLAALPRLQGADKAAAWASTQTTLGFLDTALTGTPARAPLHAAARALLAPQLAALGWAAAPGEDSETTSLRGGLIAELARYGDAATLARARALFDDDEAGRKPLPAALRDSVIRAVALQADSQRFGQLLARLKASPHDADRWLYASSLARVADGGRADQVLALALDGSLPPNIAARLPGMVAGNPAHGERAYQFTVEHWPALAALAGTMHGANSWLLPSAAEGFNRREQAQRLLRDQQRLLGESGAANAERVAAQIELRAAVQAREAKRLIAPLQALAKRVRPAH